MRSPWTPTLPRLGVVLFVSGFCSLVYQVAWLRLLRLIFGSSTASTAVVLAIFMGGLGLGGLLFGRRAERAANPLQLYARLEFGIALSAALSPLLVTLVQTAYLGLGGSAVLGQWGATPLRLVLAVVVLGAPTTLMGGTLPAVAQAMERSADAGRRIVAHLYGVNTLGAVLGAFLSTFVLLEALGVRRSLWLAAAFNVLLAVVVRAMSRQAAPVETDAAEAPAAEAAPAVGTTPILGRGAVRLVLAAAFVVGFAFFLMELVWYRMLAPILGGSSYTFGLILAVALVGIGAGGWLYALGSQRRRPGLGALALTCGLEAVFLVVPWILGDHLAYLTWLLRDLGASGFATLVAGWTLVTAGVVLPTALVAGYQFPLLVALLGAGREHVGSEVGLAYAWNTFGAILGSLAGGFLLLPLLGAPLLWQASAVALVVLSAALVRRLQRRQWAPLAALWIVALLGLLADGPSAFWRPHGDRRRPGRLHRRRPQRPAARAARRPPLPGARGRGGRVERRPPGQDRALPLRQRQERRLGAQRRADAGDERHGGRDPPSRAPPGAGDRPRNRHDRRLAVPGRHGRDRRRGGARAGGGRLRRHPTPP